MLGGEIEMIEVRNKRRKLLGYIIIVLAIVILGYLSYGLYHICFALYRAELMAELAAMLIGVIFTGAIIGIFYMIIVTWKELALLQ